MAISPVVIITNTLKLKRERGRKSQKDRWGEGGLQGRETDRQTEQTRDRGIQKEGKKETDQVGVGGGGEKRERDWEREDSSRKREPEKETDAQRGRQREGDRQAGPGRDRQAERWREVIGKLFTGEETITEPYLAEELGGRFAWDEGSGDEDVNLFALLGKQRHLRLYILLRHLLGIAPGALPRFLPEQERNCHAILTEYRFPGCQPPAQVQPIRNPGCQPPVQVHPIKKSWLSTTRAGSANQKILAANHRSWFRKSDILAANYLSRFSQSEIPGCQPPEQVQPISVKINIPCEKIQGLLPCLPHKLKHNNSAKH